MEHGRGVLRILCHECNQISSDDLKSKSRLLLSNCRPQKLQEWYSASNLSSIDWPEKLPWCGSNGENVKALIQVEVGILE